MRVPRGPFLALVLAAVAALSASRVGASAGEHPTGIGVAKLGLGTVTSRPGGIACGTACQAGFAEGETVELTATPAPGESFQGWNGCEPADASTCTVEIWDLECVVARFTGGGATATPNCSAVPPLSPPPLPAGDHPPPGAPCTIVGTRRDDILRGTAGDDVICGRAGDDLLLGGPGHDVLLGGGGRDRLLGEAGRDYLQGGPGPDVLVGGRGDDELFGGGGADLLRARDGVLDVADGGRGRDRARVDPFDLLHAVERRL
ncbi:MAG: hypothetical protein ICV74_08140 [Thermoleophilia bacterium]|nr:hypothetical protein [Thermoleophilia bacterium]